MGIAITIGISLISLIILFNYLDKRKKRICTFLPKVSFIVPCYNDGDSIGETIKSIYKTYPKNKFSLVVINDASTDDSGEKLKKLSKKYGFKIITNKKNLGKVKSINKAIGLTKEEFVFIVDSDIILNKKAVEDIFARFEYNKRVAAVSCRYKPKNESLLTDLQQLDYNMQTLINGAHNLTSGIALWGGNMVIRRKALEEVGLFSYDMLTEDIDMALKLGKKGWKVEQSFIEMETFVPEKIGKLIKQRIRWGVGGVQCFFRHPTVYLRNPLGITFMICFMLLGTLITVSIVKFLLGIFQFFVFWDSLRIMEGTILQNIVTTYNSYDDNLWISLRIKLLFGLVNTPAIFMEIKKRRKVIKNILLFFPLVLLYYPMISMIYVLSIPKGLWTALTYKEGKRGW